VNRAVKVLGAAALGALAWGTLVEPRLFTVRRHTLPIMPHNAAPVRVLQLSDLHLAPWQHRKIAWVRQLAELRPDFVILTGDLMGHLEAHDALMYALEPFRGTPGVFVHGSNDYYGPIAKNPFKYLTAPSRLSTRHPDLDNAALTAGLRELGFADLNNAATTLTVGGTPFEFVGLGDPHIRYDDPATMHAAMAAAGMAAAGVTAGDTAGSHEVQDRPVRLGVVHAPYQSALNTLLSAGASAIFAGHTHGGQVRVPGIGALTSNCDLPVGQARGLSVWYDAERAAYLNVSAGLGGSIYAPVRFACRPEASLLTLE